MMAAQMIDTVCIARVGTATGVHFKSVAQLHTSTLNLSGPGRISFFHLLTLAARAKVAIPKITIATPSH